MAAFTIMLSADGKTVTLSAMGHFDMSLGFALWQYCEPDRNRHESYIVDLADVTDMRDSGLGWLVMLRQWARRSGARVRVIHARPAIAYRLLTAGIAHDQDFSQPRLGAGRHQPVEREEHYAASAHAQNEKLRVTRAERGSTGWKWMSCTPAAGSPGSREA
ncbi:MAG: STAS domain-containing protein [Gammaproteobacteria bacterium]